MQGYNPIFLSCASLYIKPMPEEKDWKLKLRYGKLKTPYQHFTVIAPVVIEEYIEGLDAQPGNAYAGIKLWATNIDEAIHIVASIGEEKGYMVSGRIEVYETPPERPPQDEPYAYSINFTYYRE
jgi:hypothetical protein